MSRSVIAVLCIVSTAVIIYLPCLQHSFLTNWDDNFYITHNSAITGFSWWNLKNAFSSIFFGNYAPLQIVSYMLDYEIWGLDPFGFKLTNILLHAANAALLLILFRKLGFSPLTAFLAALLFVVHPVQVESVAWLSQRKNLLSFFFFALSFICYLIYRDDQEKTPTVQWCRLSVALFACALLTKIAAVVLPALLLLHEVCGNYEISGIKKILVRLIPFWILSVLFSALTLLTQQPYYGGGLSTPYGATPVTVALTMPTVFVRYLELLSWPSGLQGVYDPLLRSGFDPVVLFSLIVLTGVGVLLGIAWRRNRRLFFWGAYFWIALLPVSQIVPLTTFMNDRYLYFAFPGFALLAGYGIAFLASYNHLFKVAALTVTGAALCLLAYLTIQREQVWKDSLSFWRDSLTQEPSNDIVAFGMADALHINKRYSEAEYYYNRAIFINPDYTGPRKGLCVLLYDTNRYGEAASCFETLVKDIPDFFDGYIGGGIFFFKLGNYDKAKTFFAMANTLRPENGEPLKLMGDVAMATLDLAGADNMYREARRKGLDTWQLFYNQASLDAMSGRGEEALKKLDSAFERGFADVVMLSNNRRFDWLRNEPEYWRIVSGRR